MRLTYKSAVNRLFSFLPSSVDAYPNRDYCNQDNSSVSSKNGVSSDEDT